MTMKADAPAGQEDDSRPGSSQPEQDAMLAWRAQRGDVDAFEQLYRRHVNRLLALCIRLHGDRSLAEDALQEAFVHAWQHLAEYRGDAAFGTWMYRIAVNTVLGRLRSQGRRERYLQAVDDEALERHAAARHDPGLAMDLEAAVAALPDGARTALVLHDIEGYAHEEIAKMTGIAPGTSKAQVHRARRLLRQRLMP